MVNPLPPGDPPRRRSVARPQNVIIFWKGGYYLIRVYWKGGISLGRKCEGPPVGEPSLPCPALPRPAMSRLAMPALTCPALPCLAQPSLPCRASPCSTASDSGGVPAHFAVLPLARTSDRWPRRALGAGCWRAVAGVGSLLAERQDTCVLVVSMSMYIGKIILEHRGTLLNRYFPRFGGYPAYSRV